MKKRKSKKRWKDAIKITNTNAQTKTKFAMP
jgi:hypothetical protein